MDLRCISEGFGGLEEGFIMVSGGFQGNFWEIPMCIVGTLELMKGFSYDLWNFGAISDEI